jgi:hypothetical protein
LVAMPCRVFEKATNRPGDGFQSSAHLTMGGRYPLESPAHAAGVKSAGIWSLGPV